jgi:peptidoglycan-associated lipoprotein
MLNNNKFRMAVLALATTTLMACQSGPSEEEKAAEANAQAQAAQAEKDAQAAREAAASKARAEAADAAAKVLAEELKNQEKATLVNQNTIYFDFDRSSIKSDFMPVLRKHAAYLVANRDQTIVIEGHADQRGTPEYNIALGERRGQAIETFFLNEGVRSSQVSVVSFGEEKPAVMGASEYAMAQNRRAVVQYK